VRRQMGSNRPQLDGFFGALAFPGPVSLYLIANLRCAVDSPQSAALADTQETTEVCRGRYIDNASRHDNNERRIGGMMANAPGGKLATGD